MTVIEKAVPQAPANELAAIVLVGIDYSAVSGHALVSAAEHADMRGAELHVIHVMDPAERGVDGKLPVSEDEKRASDFVEAALARWPGARGSRIKAVVIHHSVGRPADEIVELAASLDADLVVVGTHGRHGVRRILLGSVAERLVRLSPKPVLVVPLDDVEAHAEVAMAPPCPKCVEVRRASGGKQLWCEEHRTRHGRRHTYHYIDRNVESRSSDSLLIRV